MFSHSVGCLFILLMKDKNHKVLSTDSEKAFGKTQYTYMIKALSKVRLEGTDLNIIKAIYGKPTGNNILNGQKL